MLNSRQQSVNNLLGASVNGWGIQEPEEQSARQSSARPNLEENNWVFPCLSMSFLIFSPNDSNRCQWNPRNPRNPLPTARRDIGPSSESRKPGRLEMARYASHASHASQTTVTLKLPALPYIATITFITGQYYYHYYQLMFHHCH